MDVRVGVVGGGAAAQHELGAWLRREPELRGAVREVAGNPGPEAMAVPVEWVVAVLGSSALGGLARSVRTYLEHRRPDVRVEVETARGRVRVSLADAEDSQELLDKLKEIITAVPDGESDS